jgi:DNA-binding NarL/FixJ family response regulator
MATLSKRQRQVCRLVVDGLTNKQIAQKLALSTRTVECHRGMLYRKLEVRNVVGLMRRIIAEGAAAGRSCV